MDYYRLTDKYTPVLEKDIQIWFDWFCHAPADWKIIDTTPIDKNTKVVTVYYGKDDTMHEPETPPLLWRTEIQRGDDCEVYWPYSTRAQAEFNHSRAVRNIRYKSGEPLVRHERRNKSIAGRLRRVLKGLHR